MKGSEDSENIWAKVTKYQRMFKNAIETKATEKKNTLFKSGVAETRDKMTMYSKGTFKV